MVSSLLASLMVVGAAFALVYAVLEAQESTQPSSRDITNFEPAHKFRAKSTVTIHHKRNQKKRFFGRVRSKRRKCRKFRRVVLIKTRGALSDIVLRRTKTGRLGKWSVRLNDKPRGGYYAKVVKRGKPGYLHFHRCRAATSPIIRVARRRR
jgi:hypothetical protein